MKFFVMSFSSENPRNCWMQQKKSSSLNLKNYAKANLEDVDMSDIQQYDLLSNNSIYDLLSNNSI